MDKCEKFKDLILTDYIDGETDQAIRAQIDAHILACPQCLHFAEEVKKDLVIPFTQASRETVPDSVWDGIKERIGQEIPWSIRVGEFVNGLMGSLTLPKLAPIFTSLVLLVLVGSTVLHDQQVRQVKEKEQGEYLISVLASADQGAETDNTAETPIETYFL